MNLAPMRYKDYVWPHNPETYTISFKRQVAVAKVPFGRYGMQDLGMSYRVMEGEGVFAGKGAYDEFKKLASVFYQGGPGLLIHPVWQASLCCWNWRSSRLKTTCATALPSGRRAHSIRRSSA